MKLSSVFKAFAVLAYFFIFLKGTMISLPMVIYLLFTLVDWGTTQQLFSTLAFLGLILYFSHPVFLSPKKKLLIDSIVFLCLASPVVYRLLSSHPGLHNYPLFVIPVVCFGLLFLTALVLVGRQALQPHSKNEVLDGESSGEEQ
jgi:hypothetical protein